MSGHSKWAQIKHKKALTDAKKSQIFSKLAAGISLAAKEAGGDVETNAKLRLAVEKAKQANMPSANIERAIKRGTGEVEGAKFEEVTYEVYGPNQIAILIKVITDNKNRTSAEIKKVLADFGGKLAQIGSVKWLFQEKGVARIPKEKFNDGLALELIEKGAQDFKEEGEEEMIISQISDLGKIKKYLQELGIKILAAEPEMIAKEYINIEDAKTRKKLEELFQTLDDQNEVEQIYSNAKL